MKTPATAERATAERLRLQLDFSGAVQGVGFRPFMHRLATAERLGGFVRNTGDGVCAEIEGDESAIARFLERLEREIAPPAQVQQRQVRRLPAQGERQFRIVASDGAGSAAQLPVDLACCAACRSEIFDSNDRRHRYPFTSCTHCGPRYSLIEALPYDRARTAMRHFAMCAACNAEYRNPASRRFHAEINACPDCGPQLALWDASGQVLAVRDAALTAAAQALRAGSVVALQGLGGFQLLVDARNDAAIRRLRERKRRAAKPFAVMAPDLAAARELALVSPLEQVLLESPAAPIVLLRARAGAVAASVAPDNPLLGLMLPSTPLHHLLLRELGFAVVATSGNRSGAPIIADAQEALECLGRSDIADLLLVHDRPIQQPVDDSVVRVIAGRETVLRCARGYAPLTLPHAAARAPALALGGHLKSALALIGNGRLVLGPHIGDLDSPEARAAHARARQALLKLHRLTPETVACDAHPDYHSTRVAEDLGLPLRRVPHHLAHLLAGRLDNGLTGPVLGVVWDGSGHDGDGIARGGEFIVVEERSWHRVAQLRPFRLPGGEAAVREPRRAALGVCYALYGETALAMLDIAPAQRPVFAAMLARGLNAPWTTSAGRLFDAAASLLGLRQQCSFEGQAAMALEFAGSAHRGAPLPAPQAAAAADTVDWRPLLAWMLDAHRRGAPGQALAAAFHDGLAAMIVAVAKTAGIGQVLLSGGCFQNALLTELAVAALRAAGFEPYWHHRIPPNDGGLAAGQAVFASGAYA